MNKSIKHFLATALLLMSSAVTISAQQKYVGGDISCLPSNESKNAQYLDKDGKPINNLLSFFKEQGKMNAMRVRLFVAPEKYTGQDKDANACQDLEYVKALGKRIKDAGLNFMLDFHYSDTWADPAKQWTPADWAQLSDSELEAKIYEYTKNCLTELKAAGAEPDMIQTGNEISYGMMWGTNGTDESLLKKCYINNSANWTRFTNLLKQAGKACREVCPQAKIILHTERAADLSVLKNFYSKMKEAQIDYDIIGLSYYPIWHKDIATLEAAINALEQDFPDKDIMIVEVGYGYSWQDKNADFDYSNQYPLNEKGQQNFTRALITMLNKHHSVTGLFWWWMEYNAYPYNTTHMDGWWYAPLFDSNTGKALAAFYEMTNFAPDAAGIQQPVISRPQQSDDWYTIDGMKLPRKPLKRGAYINNKKKVVVQ